MKIKIVLTKEELEEAIKKYIYNTMDIYIDEENQHIEGLSSVKEIIVTNYDS